jgi:abequosyltransferase
MSIKLSICIPTYNRAAFLGEALDSVIRQATDEVEIVVSDNASTDNTEALVRAYQARFPRIRYHKNPENLGADRNYLKVVELAEGEYCWLLGSDDIFKLGAVSHMLAEINSAHDIYICNRTECDFFMRPKRDRFWLNPQVNTSTYNLHDNTQLLYYLRSAQSIGAIFSYISSIVFKRFRWATIKYEDSFTGTAYAHVYVLFSIVKQGCYLKYIRDPLVYCRGGNDSFSTPSLSRRVLVDIDGYVALADRFFADNPDAYAEIIRCMLCTCRVAYFSPLRRLLKIRNLSEFEDWQRLKQRSFQLWGCDPAFFIADVFRVPRFLVKLAVSVKHRIGWK